MNIFLGFYLVFYAVGIMVLLYMIREPDINVKNWGFGRNQLVLMLILLYLIGSTLSENQLFHW